MIIKLFENTRSIIIKYLDSGLDEEGNWFYIVTEYILGENLEKYIKEKQMKIEEILSLYLKILKGCQLTF